MEPVSMRRCKERRVGINNCQPKKNDLLVLLEYENNQILREVALHFIAAAVDDRELIESKTCSPLLNDNCELLNIVKAEKSVLEEAYDNCAILGEKLLCQVAEALKAIVNKFSCSELSLQAELSDYFKRQVFAACKWEKRKRYSVTLLLYAVQIVSESIHRLFVPYNKKCRLFSSLLSAVFETCNGCSSMLEEHWLQRCRLRQELRSERELEHQRKMNLEHEEKFSASRITRFGGTKGLLDRYRVTFEDVTRELMVSVICSIDKHECDWRSKLTKNHGFYELEHYRRLSDTALDRVYGLSYYNTIKWVRPGPYMKQLYELYWRYRDSFPMYRQEVKAFIRNFICENMFEHKWTTITGLLFLLEGPVETWYRRATIHSYAREKSCEFYLCLLEAVYWAFVGVERPQEMQSYLQWH